jgi:hypothetical protein
MSIKTFCAGIGTLALIGGLAACSTTAAAQPHSQPTVVTTKVVTRTVVQEVSGPTVTMKVPEAGPTVTVNSDSAQLALDTTCIDVLYQNIQGWAASGIVPSGWWATRCPMP